MEYVLGILCGLLLAGIIVTIAWVKFWSNLYKQW